VSVAILLGSARSDGFTAQTAAHLSEQVAGSEVIDLLRLRIAPFRYGGSIGQDDFLPLVRQLCGCGTIVFATPVYWYAMSALMKTLFDRFTDLLGSGDAGQMGRALFGRRTWLLASGTDPALPMGFEVPFERSSTYFGMIWRGACYVQVKPTGCLAESGSTALPSFAARIAAG
jgi:multimeric flavodoxin WrbA